MEGRHKKVASELDPSLETLLEGPADLLQRHIFFQDLMVRLSTRFIHVRIDMIDATIQESLEEIGQLLRVDRVFIFEYDFKESLCNNIFEWCSSHTIPHIQNQQAIPFDRIQGWLAIHLQGRTIRFDDIQEMEDEDVKAQLEKQGIKSLIAVPITRQGRCIGFVGFDTVHDRCRFGEEEKDLLGLFAQMLVNVWDYAFMDESIRDSEEKLNTIMKEMPCVIWSVSWPDKEVIYFSPSAEGLYKRPLRVIMGNSDVPYEFIHPDDILHMKDNEIALFSKGYCEEEYRLLRPDESYVWIHSVRKVVFNEHGQPIRVHGMETDITGLKEAEALLVQAKQAAEEAGVMKSQFLMNMSHELRNPLTGLKGFSELLRSTFLNDDQMKFLGHIEHASQALITVVSNILDYSKIDSGRMTLSPSSTNLRDLCHRVLTIVEVQATGKDIDFQLDFDSKLHGQYLIDPVRFQQVLLNLLGNAFKFTEKGKVTLSCQPVSNQDDHHAQRIRFAVQDTGIGIFKESMSRIFNVFEQIDGSTTRKYGGSGLGIPICEGILNMMGSSLQVSSQLKKGSVFWFELDLTRSVGSGT